MWLGARCLNRLPSLPARRPQPGQGLRQLTGVGRYGSFQVDRLIDPGSELGIREGHGGWRLLWN
jgi:hypothetical protein